MGGKQAAMRVVRSERVEAAGHDRQVVPSLSVRFWGLVHWRQPQDKEIPYLENQDSGLNLSALSVTM